MSEPTTPVTSNVMEVMPTASAHYVQEAEARSLNFLNPKLWQAMGHAAQIFIQSGALPQGIKNAPQAIMVMQAGYEMGLQPVEALQSFCFINGKLSLFGEVAIALVVRQGHVVTWGKCDATTATVTIKNKNTGSEMTSTFTMAMARDRKICEYYDREAKQWKTKEPWKVAPDNMLKFKAFHMTAKFVCPEAFHGVPTSEELQEVETIKVSSKLPDDEQTIEIEAPTKVKPVKEPTSLEAALDEPEVPKPDPKEKPLKAPKSPSDKTKAKEVAETVKTPQSEESPAVEPVTELTDEEKYNSLVEKEIKGLPMTGVEKMFIARFESTRKAKRKN